MCVVPCGPQIGNMFLQALCVCVGRVMVACYGDVSVVGLVVRYAGCQIAMLSNLEICEMCTRAGTKGVCTV